MGIPGQQPPPEPQGGSAQEERTWAMFCHLAAFAGYFVPVLGSILGPFIVWQIKKDLYPLVDDQGKESMNFQITMMIAAIIAGILIVVLIGFVLVPLVYVVTLIYIIIASVQANQGVAYRYPINIRFIK